MLTNECTLISCPEILTMDEGKPTAEAVCISEGKILAVGTLEELRALAPRHRRKEIHLEEGVLLPGFIRLAQPPFHVRAVPHPIFL